MLPPGLNSPREVLLHYDRVYSDLIDSGGAHPFLFPWATLGASAVFVYLLFDHRRSRLLARLRYVVFSLLVAFESWCVWTNKARNPASGFGVGILSAFTALWVAASVIANDCQSDFRRIERCPVEPSSSQRDRTSDRGDGTETGLDTTSHNGHLRRRAGVTDAVSIRASNKPILFWQTYPTDSLVARLDWVADVFFSFRGVGWNWQTAGIPPPPTWVQAQLNGDADAVERDEPVRTSRTGIRRFGSRAALLRTSAINLIIGYIALDGLKTLVANDPYFWGYTSAPAPDHLPDFIRASHVLTRSWRLLVSLAAIYAALRTIFALGPAFFCGLLGPRWIGLRGEAWLNPLDMFGSMGNALDKGLAGWWGGFWHQTFRFAFEAPTARLLARLGVDKRSKAGNLTALAVAFLLSGCLHACGSHSQLGATRPLMGPMRFFALQAVGIAAQTLAADLIASWGVLRRTPTPLKRLLNFLLVHFWLYHTAPILVDDFAQGGIWLFEPVPVSVFRGLGLGPKDAGWWCDWDGIAGWRTGKGLLDTGIAV